MNFVAYPFYFAISLIFALAGAMGNATLLGFCLRKKRYYKMTSIEFFVALLACFNLIKTTIFTVIAYSAYLIASWNYGLKFCVAVSKVGAVTYLMTEVVLISLTYINYKLIVTDNFYVDVPRKAACRILILALFCACGIVSIPGFYEWKITSLQLNNSECLHQKTSPCNVEICGIDLSWPYSQYIILAILAALFLPTFYFAAAFIRVHRTLKISLRKIRSNVTLMYYRVRVKENRKLLSILGVTCSGFTISYVPVMVLHYLRHREGHLSDEEKHERIYAWYTFLLFILTMIDSCSMPVTYLIQHSSFRRMLYKVFCYCCRTRIYKRRQTIKFKREPIFTVDSSSSTLKLEQYSTSSNDFS